MEAPLRGPFQPPVLSLLSRDCDRRPLPVADTAEKLERIVEVTRRKLVEVVSMEKIIVVVICVVNC